MNDFKLEHWFHVYTSALFELDYSALTERILDARSEIMSRMEALANIPGSNSEELAALVHALGALQALDRLGE